VAHKFLSEKDVRVLVVDDQQVTRTIVKAVLKSLGFNDIFTADGGKEALLILRRHLIDLIICDWNMPDMTGIEVLKSVRKDPRYEDVPFLMLTAEVYKENIAEAMKAGVTDYIAKPFTAETLSEKLEKVLVS
jgi:two-component system chemotaxis response regulator CheY